MKFTDLLTFALIISLLQCTPEKELATVEQWGVFEIELQGPSEGRPFIDNRLTATFTHEDKAISIPGFYDGNGIYKIRFSPKETGES
jgi:hypothetical protein